MATYASGMLDGGWAYAFTLGRRWGDEGFQDALSMMQIHFLFLLKRD